MNRANKLKLSKKNKTINSNNKISLRWLALSIQLGWTETFFDNESSDFVRFILLHSLQQPFITLAPVLTLWGQGSQSKISLQVSNAPMKTENPL